MSKSFPLTLALLLITLLACSQDFAQQFKTLSAKKDTAGQAKILSDWAVASPNDPELFIAYFNYYVRKSMSEVISLDSTQKDNQALVVTDTGTGKPVAYLNASTRYESDILQKGFDFIDRGLALHPARLDMRFGKIYMLGKAENYPAFTSEIVAAIDYGIEINNVWLWEKGKPLEDPKVFFLRALQDYIMTLYNTGQDDLLPNMREISEAVLSHYPDHVESLSNIALTYLITGAYENALSYLSKAEQLAPQDIIVLNNIAEACKRKGDKQNAIVYYEKIIRYGNKEEKEDARQRIKTLK